MPLFRAALRAGLHYVDMAMSLSQPDPGEPYRRTGVKLGDEQFAMAARKRSAGRPDLMTRSEHPGHDDGISALVATVLA